MRVKDSSKAGNSGQWACGSCAREGDVVSASTCMGVHGSCVRLRRPNVDRAHGRAPARFGRGTTSVMLCDNGESESLGRIEVLGVRDLQPHVDDGEGVW